MLLFNFTFKKSTVAMLATCTSYSSIAMHMQATYMWYTCKQLQLPISIQLQQQATHTAV